MTTPSSVINAPDLDADSYVIIGLATCYLRDEDEIKETTVVEPVPSAYLEAVLKGVPTSYRSLHATTIGALLTGEGDDESVTLPPSSPPEACLCSSFTERLMAAARTYRARPEAQVHVAPGTSRTDINYSTEKKRILNMETVVSPEDNVKQHEYTHKVL
ncbi:hypothetical protein C7271_13075 [filamentous cyanobacterium CCP5]|nr:hypothetical protein C7271_13075 [filamentous cyanobacterium CCP5]